MRSLTPCGAPRPAARFAAALLTATAACSSAPDRESYRLAAPITAGRSWERARVELLTPELRAAYPAFFLVVLDPAKDQEPDLRPLRADLESEPTRPQSYDALNAVAIAYFELNYRAQADPGGPHYFADSFRATKIVAVPWRAYGEIEEGRLRDAILDFFEDASSGSKEASASTAPRLLRVVASLRKKESDPRRLQRIDGIVASLAALTPTPPLE